MFFTDRLLKVAFKWRNSFCLGMFFFSAPLVYFIRDGIGVAPGSSAFTFAFLFGPLFLLLPFRSLNHFYKPNSVSYMLGISFLILSAIYLFTYAPNRSWFTNTIYETIVIGVTLYIFFSLTTVSTESLGKRFLLFAIFISLAGCFFLILYLIRNPAYAIGSRASIALGKGNNVTDNPHVFGRGAFLGLVAALLYLKHESRASVMRLIVTGSIVIFVAVILLAQAMSAIIATALFFLAYFKYSISFAVAKNFVKKQLTTWYFWVFTIFTIAYGFNFYSKNKEPIRIAFNVVTVRVEKLLNTFYESKPEVKKVGLGKQKVKQIDGSAAGRVETFNKVVDNLTYNIENGNFGKILFGNGYHHLYVDIPVLEPLNSFGIVGFLFFLTFFLYISNQAFREIKGPNSITSEFVAYAFIYFFVYTFTNGLIIEYIRWGYFALACRFLPISFSKSNVYKV